MAKVSVVIPAREEPFLQRTVTDLLTQARGDIEVLAVLDGYWPDPPLAEDKRLKVLHWSVPKGVRPAINAAARIATGQYLLKIDAHCGVSEGYDLSLQAHCEDNWIVVPEKYSLLPETWERFREPWQYFYLTYPWDPVINHPGLHDKHCGPEVNAAKIAIQPIDDILTYQGSCWFLSAAHFGRIGPMDHEHYFIAQEPQELGLRTWLTGGRVVVNKSVWYAHLHKGRGHRRGFRIDKGPWIRALRWSAEYWMAQPGMAALVEKFWPVLRAAEWGPWPRDWEDPKYRAAIVAREQPAA